LVELADKPGSVVNRHSRNSEIDLQSLTSVFALPRGAWEREKCLIYEKTATNCLVTVSSNWWSWPISRVLSWIVIRLGLQSLTGSSNLPASSMGHTSGSLFGLASGGVYLALTITR